MQLKWRGVLTTARILPHIHSNPHSTIAHINESHYSHVNSRLHPHRKKCQSLQIEYRPTCWRPWRGAQRGVASFDTTRAVFIASLALPRMPPMVVVNRASGLYTRRWRRRTQRPIQWVKCGAAKCGNFSRLCMTRTIAATSRASPK